MTKLATALIVALALATAACNRPSKAAGVETGTAKVAAAAPAISKPTRIIFVGKEHACDCTRKSIDAGWTALQTALGAPARLPIERLQVDTEGAKVEPYRKQKPIMALPAIYFVDGKDTVLELLQGEVTPEQVGSILGR